MMTARRSLWMLSLALGCVASEKPEGSLVVTADAVTARVTRVTVTIAPAGIQRDLFVDPQVPTRFTGSISAPAGVQTVTAEAFDGTQHVGTGSATATVQKGAAVSVQITILDDTGPPPAPDHSPVVTSLVTPASLEVGDQPTLTATAMDADGDPLAYAWTGSPPGCGTFGTPAAASTVFTANLAGACTVTFSATAGGKTDAKTAQILIGVATGTIDVTVDYVPHPVLSNIAFSQGGTAIASVPRTAADATIRASFHRGTAYTVTLSFDAWPTGSLSLSDSCSGTIVQPTFVGNATSATATWTPTVSSGACLVTATITRVTLTDSFLVVVLPVP